MTVGVGVAVGVGVTVGVGVVEGDGDGDTETVGEVVGVGVTDGVGVGLVRHLWAGSGRSFGRPRFFKALNIPFSAANFAIGLILS